MPLVSFLPYYPLLLLLLLNTLQPVLSSKKLLPMLLPQGINLMLAKITQSFHSNPSHGDPVTYNIGDKVMLSTLNRRKEYKSQDQLHITKFMPRYLTLSSIHMKPCQLLHWIFPMLPTSSPPSPPLTSYLLSKMMTSNILPIPWKNLDQSPARILKSSLWTRSLITRKSASQTSSTWFAESVMALKMTNGFRDAT